MQTCRHKRLPAKMLHYTTSGAAQSTERRQVSEIREPSWAVRSDARLDMPEPVWIDSIILTAGGSGMPLSLLHRYAEFTHSHTRCILLPREAPRGTRAAWAGCGLSLLQSKLLQYVFY